MNAHRTVALELSANRAVKTTIHYWVYGSAPARDSSRSEQESGGPAGRKPARPGKPVMVMVHGFRGDHHGLELIAKALPHRRVIVPDLPGFGESDPLPGPHDLGGYVRFLEAFIRGLDLPAPPVLLGHSFGSIVAAHYAAEHPETIGELVLVNPIASPALKGPRAVLTRLAVLYYRAAAALPEQPGLALLRNPAIVRGMSIVMAKTRRPELRRYIHDQHHRHFSSFHDRRSLLEAFTTSVGHTAAEAAPRISTPTLLIVSDRDDISSLPDQERLHAALPDSRMTVVHNVGHLIHYEAPEHAAVAIETFLAES